MKKIVWFLIGFCAVNTVFAQEEKYGVAAEKWDTDSLGNHRVVLMVNSNVPVAKATVMWRRRDENPQNKRIIVEDGQTHKKIDNVKVDNVTNLSGDIYFQPTSDKGVYYVYYMPYKNEGRSNYPKGVYLQPENTAETGWLQKLNNAMKPNAVVKEIQAVDSLNSFYPMEVIATKKEVADLVATSGHTNFIVFPDDRIYPIKMNHYLPYRWVQKGMSNTFKGEADKGENYSFQIGIYALKTIENVSLSFSDLQGPNGSNIKASDISCLNNTGTRYDGSPFTNAVTVPADTVQAMWCLVTIPKNVSAGIYKGKVTINNSSAPQVVNIEIKVNDKVAVNGNIAEPWKQTRLKWLNSTMAQENTLIQPYTALQVQGNTISLLGRKVVLNNDGLPQQIQTFFSPEMTDYTTSPNNLLTAPIGFQFINNQQQTSALQTGGLQFTHQTEGTVTWHATSTNDALQMDVSGSLEFDGFVAYTVKMIAKKDVTFQDITMQIPFAKQASKYMMGLGKKRWLPG